jgi:hypothetical protein
VQRHITEQHWWGLLLISQQAAICTMCEKLAVVSFKQMKHFPEKKVKLGFIYFVAQYVKLMNDH